MTLNDFKLHSIEDVLKVGNKVIPDKFQKRFEEIEEYNIIFENDREKIYNHYLNEMYKYNIFKKTNYNPMMIIHNFCSKGTNALLKFTMSENPIYSLSEKNETLNNYLNKYVRDYEFNEKLKQIITRIDVTGNCFCRIINSLKDKSLYDLQILDSNQVYVITDIMTDEVIAYVVFTIYKQDNNTYTAKYLVSEIGKNTYYNVRIDNGVITSIQKERVEKLNYNDFSVQNFVVNREYNNYNYGVSSYRDVVTLQSNFIVGYNMLMSINSRYSSPTMYGPHIETEGESEPRFLQLKDAPVPEVQYNTGKAINPTNLNKNEDTVSLAGRYIEIPDKDAVKPGYMTWDGQLTQQMAYYAAIKNDIGNFIGFPEIVKDDAEWTSNIISGKALKLKSMSSIEKASSFISSIKYKLENLLSILTGITDNEIVINFQDGIVDFPDEELEYVTGRISNGTMSKADAIAYLDGLSLEEAKLKVEEIIEEMKKEKELEDNGNEDIDNQFVDNENQLNNNIGDDLK